MNCKPLCKVRNCSLCSRICRNLCKRCESIHRTDVDDIATYYEMTSEAYDTYTTYVSNTMMIVKEDRIVDKDIPNQFNGVKIIQFSDLHYGTTFFEKQLKKMVKEINDRNPDLVVFTGDLIDKEYKVSSEESEMINKYLSRIKTKLGKYAVSGEEDGDEFTTIMNQSGFTILNNNYDVLITTDERGKKFFLNSNLNYKVISSGYSIKSIKSIINIFKGIIESFFLIRKVYFLIFFIQRIRTKYKTSHNILKLR